MKFKIFTLALASVALASCQKEDVLLENGNFPADGVIRVTTEVADTRAGHTTENLTEFGFFVDNPTNPTYSYSNVKMTKNSSDWTSASQMLWQNATTEVDISAYAPYNTDETYWAAPVVLANQNTEANVKASDYIFMYKSPFVPKTNLDDKKGKVELEHKMAKLDFRIIIGTECNASGIPQTNPISDITVNGTKLKGYLVDSSIEPHPTDNPAAAITPFMAKYTAAGSALQNCIAEYEAIFIPQTVTTTDKFEIKFQFKGREYLWTATKDIILKGGNKYALDLTAGSDIVTAGAMSATEWGNGTGEKIETE